MDFRVILLLTAEALFGYALLYFSGAMKTKAEYGVSALLMLVLFALRAAVFPYETLDYQNFLTHWVDYFRFRGGFAALADNVGNYNIPYLYFMALFSYSSIRDLYLIKLLSVFFDVVLAWSAMQLLSLFRKSRVRRLGLFFAVLAWPTVFLNGALWGQCDSIYAALMVLAVYLALSDRPVLSMVSLALSFGFKLQAVFVMPVFAVLFFMKKIRWQHLPVFALSYVLLVLPAVLCGRPLLDTITLYLHQTGSIGDSLNYNSSSLFAVFYRFSDTAAVSRIAVLGAFTYMLLLLLLAFVFRKKLTGISVVGFAVLFAVGIPFLLPHMHDRYFFCADILTLILSFIALEYILSAFLTEFASFLGYYAYLQMRFLLPMQYGAFALVLVLLHAALFTIESTDEKFLKKST